MMAGENLPEEVAEEIADLLNTTPRVVQMMTEDQVIKALVGDDLS
jgi:hypothetical protein